MQPIQLSQSKRPKIKKWLAQVVGKEGEDLSRHDKWLCMMYPQINSIGTETY